FFLWQFLWLVFLWFICPFTEVLSEIRSEVTLKVGGFGVFTEDNEGKKDLVLPKPNSSFSSLPSVAKGSLLPAAGPAIRFGQSELGRALPIRVYQCNPW